MKTRKSSKENSEIQQAMVAEETSKRPRLTINPIQYSKDPRVNEAIKKDIEASRRTLAWLEAQEQVVHPLGYVGESASTIRILIHSSRTNGSMITLLTARSVY